MTEQKLKVLVLADYCCTTGFATVASNIMMELHKSGEYEIDVVGINYTGDPYDPERFPGRVFPAMNIANLHHNDPYGRQKVLDMLGMGEYDIFFTIQDTFIIQTFIQEVMSTNAALHRKFKTIMYFPFDCVPKKEWIEQCVGLIDYPVAYTEYAKGLAVEVLPSLANMPVIYHGTNLADFNYIEDREQVTEFRHKYFAGKADDRFLITNVNRNQVRKDPMRNFMILAELKSRGLNPLLYLHMKHEDAGGNLLVMAENFGLKLQEDFILPSPKFFNENRGLGVDAMNLIYNASDAVLSTTHGEGWGLSITEAMATKTPVVAPDNTSISEILADDRGVLVGSGNNPSMWISLGGADNERMRPLMDVSGAADAFERLMNEDGKPNIDNAYAFAQKYNWTTICKQWKGIFDEAGAAARKATSQVGIPNREQRRKLKKSKGRK